MDSENPRLNVASTITINLGDPGLMSLLLRLLERQLDKHIYDNEYVRSWQ